MIAQAKQPPLTPEEYLALEEQHDVKHEYVDGQVYGMAGTTDRHNTIAFNTGMLLRNHLRGSGCKMYFADVKARIDSCNCFYYPDLMVTCDPRDAETPLYKRFPKLIVEVLSDSTEAFDRGDKFTDYQSLLSLEEYVLIGTKRQRVETFRRGKDGFWVLQTYGLDLAKPGVFMFESVGLVGQIAELYDEAG
jgi:Uma2 family endonuclease